MRNKVREKLIIGLIAGAVVLLSEGAIKSISHTLGIGFVTEGFLLMIAGVLILFLCLYLAFSE